MQNKWQRGAVAALVVLAAVTFVRTAWMSDDAYITLRTVDNFLNGYGLTWNVAERVQSYTHPLWMFLLTAVYAIKSEAFVSTIVLSIVISLSAILVMVWRVAISPAAAIVTMIALLFSRAFVDYSTSGLENPLTHLLLAVFLAAYLTRTITLRRFAVMCAMASLLSLTRMDGVLLVIPALVVAFMELPRRPALHIALIALLPFVLWEMFSLLYYGFPLANTVYAKLNTGIARSELVRQGLIYMSDLLRNDPVTLLVTVGVAATCIVRKRQRPLAIGIVAFLIYLVLIGGDFMRGRFLTPPFLCAVAILSRYPFASVRQWAPVAAAIIVLGALPSRPPIVSGLAYGAGGPEFYKGITDERAVYFQSTGLLRLEGFGVERCQSATAGAEARKQGVRLLFKGAVGMVGYYAGPGVHVLDGMALADPLLARLPVRGVRWRIGHFIRERPAGYMKTLAAGDNVIKDPNIHAYYDHLAVVTRGGVFDRERMATVLRFNLGAYNDLVAPYFRARKLQDRAVRELARGDTGNVIDLTRVAVSLEPRRAASWNLMMQAHVARGEFDEAWRAASYAAEILPEEYSRDLLEIGIIYERQGSWATALEVIREALRQDNTMIEGYAVLGSLYERGGRDDVAIRVYERSLQVDPDQPEIVVRLNALRERGRSGE